MKKRNLRLKINLQEIRTNKITATESPEKRVKVGDFLKVVLLKRDPLTLRGYFEEVKGFCVSKSRKGGVLKLANIVKQVRFYYKFHIESIAVKSVKITGDRFLTRRGLRKKRLFF